MIRVKYIWEKSIFGLKILKMGIKIISLFIQELSFQTKDSNVQSRYNIQEKVEIRHKL
jgi:hypothetical protein